MPEDLPQINPIREPVRDSKSSASAREISAAVSDGEFSNGVNLRRRNFIKLSVFSLGAFILGKISAPFLTSNGNSGNSNLAQVGVVGPPTTPTGLVATPVSSSQVNLAWTPSTDNTGVANYRVNRQLGLPTTPPPPPPGTPPPPPTAGTIPPAGTGYIDVPNSDDNQSYRRWSNEIVVKGNQRFRIGGGAVVPVTIYSAQGAVTSWNSADFIFDSTKIPDGHYVAQAANCKPMDFVIQNGSKPLRGPLIPLIHSQMLEDKSLGSAGVMWVPYSDPPPLPNGNRIAPRIMTAHGTLPTDTNRSLFWMRPLVTPTGVWSPFKQWREDEFGNIHIGYFQQYYRDRVQGLITGNLRDGLYGRGGVGTPVCLREHPDGSILVVAINAGVKRIWPDLRVETVWGLRLPEGKPIPHTSWDTSMTAEQRSQSRRSRYELVGSVEPKNPWSVCVDTDDPDIIWISNTDGHHVLEYRMSTKQTISIIGSPTGITGRKNGIGTDVLMRRPRGLGIRKKDGLLYVFQAWNHSIGTINRQTKEYKELWRSIKNWDNFTGTDGTFNTRGTNFYGFDEFDLRPQWEVDGPNGVGSCHHPQQADLTSDDKFIFGCDHTRVIKEYDPDTNTVKLVANVPAGDFNDDASRHTAWISLAVNKNGLGATKDNIAYADFQQQSLRIFDRTTGNALYKPIRDPTRSGTIFGFNNRVDNPGYPWAVGFRENGSAFIWGDSGSEIIQEMSLRQSTDVDYDNAAIKEGLKAWLAAPPQGGLSLASIYHTLGVSQLGFTQFQDMAKWSDTQIKSWLTQRRPDLTGTVLDNLVVYIRYSQQPPL